MAENLVKMEIIVEAKEVNAMVNEDPEKGQVEVTTTLIDTCSKARDDNTSIKEKRRKSDGGEEHDKLPPPNPFSNLFPKQVQPTISSIIGMKRREKQDQKMRPRKSIFDSLPDVNYAGEKIK